MENQIANSISQYANEHPELVFGLVGPIGVNLDLVQSALCDNLRRVGYDCETIRVTDIMRDYGNVSVEIDDDGYASRYKSLIDYANKFCAEAEYNGVLAGLCILEIRKRRKSSASDNGAPSKIAYVIRQLKRPEEIELLRQTYGRKFIQVSVYASEEKRTQSMINKIREKDHTQKNDAEIEGDAKALIIQDADESDEPYGQRVKEIFHGGDIFVYGHEKKKINDGIYRFVDAFFGNNSISPTKDEHGLYMALAASLRSSDLSRQVGAAICGEDGQIISMGCNEVPKAGGGAYWQEDGVETFRDVDKGADANYQRKVDILYDLVNRLTSLPGIKFVGEESDKLKDIIKDLLRSDKIKSSQMMDLIEFGRMMHAEMAAIVDCALHGRSCKDATLYCTTFPCHMCAKHIVGAGISRVVFLEPYPKSYAKTLHGDSITIEEPAQSKVLFQPFIGIAPTRYRDIFQKGKRKDSSGIAREWYEGKPVPRIDDRSSAYLYHEEYALEFALAKVLPQWKSAVGEEEASDGGLSDSC